jgi:uncharacterized protein YbcC (UPF0753/DUF2309 family)
VSTPATQREAFEDALAHAAHYLPDQGPIEVFVHHNTLHAFESEPFHEAVQHAQRVLGVNGLWPRGRYLALRKQGRIDDVAIAHATQLYCRHTQLPPSPTDAISTEALLDGVLAEELFPYGSEEELQFAIDEGGILTSTTARTLLSECLRVPLRRPQQARGPQRPLLPRTLLMRAGAEDSADLVNPVMVRLTSAYLDFGLARRAWPERHRGFLAGFLELSQTGSAPVPPWMRGLADEVQEHVRRKRSAADIVLTLLSEIGVSDDDLSPVLRDVLLQLAGWAGMMSRLERVPADRPKNAPPASLLEFLAVRLIHDVVAWRHLARTVLHYEGPLLELAKHVDRRREQRDVIAGAHEAGYPLFRIVQRAGLEVDDVRALDATTRERLVSLAHELAESAAPPILHDAYELHYADRFLAALVQGGTQDREVGQPSMEVVTCIDDREESFRRALEEVDPRARTYGTAGFFGLPIAFRGLDELASSALCPVVQAPTLDLEESPAEDLAVHGALGGASKHVERAARRTYRRGVLGRLEALLLRGTRSLTWGVLLTPVVGLVSALPFAAQVLFPRATSRASRAARNSLLPAPRTRLAHPEEGRRLSLEERVGRVEATLSGIGLVKNFAELVFILGHGSSSVNNPHRSAYDCGACGGRHGGPNARYFAALANEPDVRHELAHRGIHIPETTFFVGGAHDTATDAIELYDTDLLPEHLRGSLAKARATLDDARKRSAHERCRRFAAAPRRLTFEEALRHVEGRSSDLSEARPELGHVTNAACVVGRRSATEGLFLDRRSFLVSYDPLEDEDGRTLERTLNAVGPVGAGISLEYLFSTVDNTRLGSGTKLPHNVAGLLGVMEGTESDLRTGLPRQMIEIHEPMRLLLVCEANVEVVRAILARNPGIRGLVAHEWVRLVTIDPETSALHLAVRGELEPYVPQAHALPVCPSSVAHYTGGGVEGGAARDGFLPFARIAVPRGRGHGSSPTPARTLSRVAPPELTDA